MIFAKKLCFEDLPYLPAKGEVVLEQASTGVNGVHLTGQKEFQRGFYKVEVRAGYPYMSIHHPWYPAGISMVVEMTTPFYIDAYLGGSSINARTSATTNPYSGAGKAQSNRAVGGRAQSDGIFGGAGGSGLDQGEGWAIGGGNAVGNTPAPGTGSKDAGGSSGSVCWFTGKGKGVGSLKANGAPDAFKCFHCGGHGGTAADNNPAYIFGGGGGAYGGGAGGIGYATDPEAGGSGTGGGGGSIDQYGSGIGAGKIRGQGGLAYYNGSSWVDVFNSMSSGDGVGYNTGLPVLRITYLGGNQS